MSKLFCDDAEKAIAVLREALADGKIGQFTSAVHGIKPVLASIDENEASKMARELENAGNSGDLEFIHSNAEAFIQTLTSLIEKHRPPDEEFSEEKEDAAFMVEELRLIELACDDFDDARVYAAISRLKEKSRTKKTAEAIEKMHEALYLYSDFEKTAEMAIELSEKF